MPINRQQKRPLMAEINVVPYIDVMLVLLIIFMVTVPLIQQGVEVELPKATAETMDAQETSSPLIVTVNREGAISLNQGTQANSFLLPSAFMRELQLVLDRLGQQVYVRGDREALYGQVVAVMVMLQQAGVEDIGLITRPAQSEDL